jgi:hypothetical protein
VKQAMRPAWYGGATSVVPSSQPCYCGAAPTSEDVGVDRQDQRPIRPHRAEHSPASALCPMCRADGVSRRPGQDR